jgi:hypothetical protein
MTSRGESRQAVRAEDLPNVVRSLLSDGSSGDYGRQMTEWRTFVQEQPVVTGPSAEVCPAD